MTVSIDNIPNSLKSKPYWLVWRKQTKVEQGGRVKVLKVPYYLNGHPRKSPNTPEDLQALATFTEAAQKVASGGFDGLGFATVAGAGVVALDFDNCVRDGKIDPRIEPLIADTYAEFSPSGTGVRAFMWGQAKSRKDNANRRDRLSDGTRIDGQFDVEVFGDTGFVTVTGNVTPECELFGTDVAPLSMPVRDMYLRRFKDASGLGELGEAGSDSSGAPGYGGGASSVVPGPIGADLNPPWDDDLFGENQAENGSTKTGVNEQAWQTTHTPPQSGTSTGTELALIECDDMGDLPEPTMGWTIDDLTRLLAGCASDVSYDEWLNVLMALHHESGGSPAGLEIADEWSKSADNYAGRKDVEEKWRSFGRRGGGGSITGKWLVAWRRQFHAGEESPLHEVIATEKASASAQDKKRATYERREALEKLAMDAPDEFTLREQVVPKLRAAAKGMSPMDKEALAKAIFDSFRKMGLKHPIALCRSLLAVGNERERGLDASRPEWVAGWVYVTDKDRFYRIESDEWLSMQGFNARFNRFMEGEDIGQSASNIALARYDMPTATRGVYLPWAPAGVSEMDGIQIVNTYRRSSTPIPTDKLTETGRVAVGLVLDHLRLLCGGRESTMRVLLDWMAHNVQHPGVKIRWAPLIKGVEGDGKSTIGTIMGQVMGRVNVKNVSPTVLGTDFTGWAAGSCVALLEEIKLTGHNKFDIINKMKPYLTNSTVEIHQKGQDPYDGINTTNYIAFTNFPDALPLNDTDSRWWIVFTPFANQDQLRSKLGDPVEYFQRLNDAIASHSSDLRRCLLDHQISPGFNPNSRAPGSEEKKLMVSMSVNDDESDVRSAIEEGGPGVRKEVFMTSHLTALLPDVGLKTRTLGAMFIRLGYSKLPKAMKWRGRPENVWVLGYDHPDAQILRSMLEETMVVNEGSECDLF